MSTKGTIADVSLTENVRGVTFHASISVYDECFDEDPQPVYITMWQQGYFSNTECSLTLSQEQALEFADQLTAWAASIRKHQATGLGREMP